MQNNRATERIGFSPRNLIAVSAIYRFILIITLTCGWISIAAIRLYDRTGFMYAFQDIEAIRGVYMFFGITGSLISLVILILDVINIFNVPPYDKFPINAIILGFDLVWLLGLGTISVFCILRAMYLNSFYIKFPDGFVVYASSYYNQTAFYVAAIFGFVSCALILSEITVLMFEFLPFRRK